MGGCTLGPRGPSRNALRRFGSRKLGFPSWRFDPIWTYFPPRSEKQNESLGTGEVYNAAVMSAQIRVEEIDKPESFSG